VETHDKARGYETGENRFLVVEDRELEQARSDRPPPGAVQLAEPLRPAPAASAAESGESEETEEEQYRDEVGEMLTLFPLEICRLARVESRLLFPCHA
jgi:hypothetical protein